MLGRSRAQNPCPHVLACSVFTSHPVCLQHQLPARPAIHTAQSTRHSQIMIALFPVCPLLPPSCPPLQVMSDPDLAGLMTNPKVWRYCYTVILRCYAPLTHPSSLHRTPAPCPAALDCLRRHLSGCSLAAGCVAPVVSHFERVRRCCPAVPHMPTRWPAAWRGRQSMAQQHGRRCILCFTLLLV